MFILILIGKDNSQPKEGDLSTMNVPQIQYDKTSDPLQMSKSPTRFKNNNFSPNATRGRNRNAPYKNSYRSPNQRNMHDSFNTINQSNSGMNSIEMVHPMSTINNNVMMYPKHGNMANSFNDVGQYNGPAGQQYMLSMSTNIKLGVVNK